MKELCGLLGLLALLAGDRGLLRHALCTQSSDPGQRPVFASRSYSAAATTPSAARALFSASLSSLVRATLPSALICSCILYGDGALTLLVQEQEPGERCCAPGSGRGLGAMTEKGWSRTRYAGPPVTLGNMRANGVRRSTYRAGSATTVEVRRGRARTIVRDSQALQLVREHWSVMPGRIGRT